jgi:hypothetical protein
MLISLLPFPPTPVVPMPAPPNPERDTCYRFGLAMSSIASFPWLTLAMAGSALPPLAFFDRLRHSTRLGYLGSRSAGPFLASRINLIPRTRLQPDPPVSSFDISRFIVPLALAYRHYANANSDLTVIPIPKDSYTQSPSTSLLILRM